MTLRLVMSLKALSDGLSEDQRAAHGHLAHAAMMSCATLGAKCARLTFRLTEDGLDLNPDRLWEDDTVPTLLLMEHIAEELDQELEQLRSALPGSDLRACQAHRNLLRGLTAPLFAAIPLQDRRVVEALKASGKAPSPFCTMQKPPPGFPPLSKS